MVSRPPESVTYTQCAPASSMIMACWAKPAGSFMWLIIREARDVHAELASLGDVLDRNVGLGAMGRDANRPHADAVGSFEILDRPDARKQQGGEHTVGQDIGDLFEPLPIGMCAEPVVERRSGEAVAVGDLDGIAPCRIDRLCDLANMIEAVLMADGVHAVAQGDVLDVDTVSLMPTPAFRRGARRS